MHGDWLYESIYIWEICGMDRQTSEGGNFVGEEREMFVNSQEVEMSTSCPHCVTRQNKLY